ncbi:hypothetical protein J19TS1_22650 [Heyndrickxia oleronia]|nr:hypothetical protein J19TS1_22650 [Heyndrickxia oleronia]
MNAYLTAILCSLKISVECSISSISPSNQKDLSIFISLGLTIYNLSLVHTKSPKYIFCIPSKISNNPVRIDSTFISLNDKFSIHDSSSFVKK